MPVAKPAARQKTAPDEGPRYWLMKSEPSVFSIDDLARRPRKTTHWDGVRNFQARNMLRDEMKKGDLAFFYHSSCEVPGIYGVMRIAREGYPDPSAFDPDDSHFDPKSDPSKPTWYVVDVQLLRRFAQPVTLEALRALSERDLRDMQVLRRGNRLSITPVSPAEFRCVMARAGERID
ncbi:MAG: EVE domain-containing protein [Gammaproteobacteria bacterium]|nr:EVE domain-containing protein [Gammaproteobacteria bacterium]